MSSDGKVIGGVPIVIRKNKSLAEEHIASGTIGNEVYRIFHDFNELYIVFPNRPDKDSFAVDIKKFIESAYFFDMKQKKKKK